MSVCSRLQRCPAPEHFHEYAHYLLPLERCYFGILSEQIESE